MSFAHKRMGTVGIRPVEPTGVYADEAKTRQKQRQERIALRRENFVMLNRHTYAVEFEKWVSNGGGKLIHCKRCDATIHWNEPAHVCPGFVPKYEEWTEERKDRAKQRRDEIHESRRDPSPIVCSVCGEQMPEWEDGERHWDAHEGRPEREHYAIDGEPDGDLDGYDDEPEDDWCDEDDGEED